MNQIESKGDYSLPAVITGIDVTIKACNVESLNRPVRSLIAMKKAAIKRFFDNDHAIIMGRELALQLTPHAPPGGLDCCPF